MTEVQAPDETSEDPTHGVPAVSARRPVVTVVVGLIVIVAVTGVVAALIGRNASPAPAISFAQSRAGERVGTTVAVYVDIRNDGGEDSLTSATSPIATGATLHEVDANGAMVDGAGIPVAATSVTSLEPGGSHVMLTGVSRELSPGDIVPVTLTFERAGPLSIDAIVRPLAELADGGRT